MLNKKKKNLQHKSTEVWNEYYKSQQKGDTSGNEYPSEGLVRHISNLRKNNNKFDYFNDAGVENKIRSNFKGKALEIGFGNLTNLRMVKKKGFDCYGLEVSENSVKRSKQYIKNKKIKNIKTYLWQPSKIPFKNNSFDLVYGMQCIYYNLDFEFFLEEVRRVLKKNGNFIFSFFSDKHHYTTKYSEKVDTKKNLIRWSSKHPNKRIRYAILYQPKSKVHLKSLFKKFRKVKISTYEHDDLPIFQSWWYISGIK